MGIIPFKLKIVLLAILGIGITLRLWLVLHSPTLWLDEVISAHFAQSPLLDLLLAVPRFDTHPPLYYIQLHVWSWFGDSDSWMLLNSVVLDVAVMLSLGITVMRLFDLRTGCWSAAIWAVMPLAVFFAGNLRMYPMTYLLTVWLWYMLERRLRGEEPPHRLIIFLLGAALSMTHGMGFFVAFFLWLQAVLRSWYYQKFGKGGEPKRLFLEYLPVGVFALYSIGLSLFRRTEGMDSFDPGVIGTHLTIAILGMEMPLPQVSGYFAAALLLIPIIYWEPRSRRLLFWLVILPCLILFGLSLGVKTVFMYRTVGLFLPFIAISVGLFISGQMEGSSRLQKSYAVILVALLIGAAVNTTLSFKKNGYRNITAIWEREALPDAMLFVSGMGEMWGMSRYLQSAPAYSALEVQPPVREGMLRLKQKLAGTWFERMGLFGRTDHFALGGREIWPYAADNIRIQYEKYWVMSGQDVSCLRQGDQIKRHFRADNHHLIECSHGPQ